MAVERIVPGTPEWESFYANHIVRYRFAVNHLSPLKPAKILDIACGVGYGSRTLTETGASITGADISAEALQIAKKYFEHESVLFIHDDCEKMTASTSN